MASKSGNLQDFQSFFEECPDLFCIANAEAKFTKLNKACLQKLGYTEAELLMKPITSFVHPEDLALTQTKIDAIIKGEESEARFENRFRNHNACYVWLSWSAHAKEGLIFLAAKDISESKKIKIMLNEIQQQAKIGG